MENDDAEGSGNERRFPVNAGHQWAARATGLLVTALIFS
jgi:hypothetical protein